MAIDVLVTGAAGQLGRVVLEQARARGLAAAGADVPGLGVPGLEDVSVDDRDATLAWIGRHRPKTVIHCGAWTDVDGCELDPDKAERINGQGTRNVVDGCLQHGAGVVYVSTDFVFDGTATEPIPVDAVPDPISHYGRSKLSGERAVLAAGAPRCWVARTSWVFGPGGKNFPRAILARARGGGDLTVVDDQVGRPTYTEDLAAALLDIAASDADSGVFHASNEGHCSWYQFARDLVDAAGLSVQVSPMSSDRLERPAKRPAWSVLDTGKLTALRGHAFPHYRDAIRRYLAKEQSS